VDRLDYVTVNRLEIVPVVDAIGHRNRTGTECQAGQTNEQWVFHREFLSAVWIRGFEPKRARAQSVAGPPWFGEQTFPWGEAQIRTEPWAAGSLGATSAPSNQTIRRHN
jgi:hypothetical protein